MKFVDYVTVTVRSGKGGPGSVSFRREKYAPRGGPDGGDGGKGGSVIMKAHHALYTLLDLRYNRHHFAANGGHGSGANKTGRDAEDIILKVPCGTVAKDTDTGAIIGEVLNDGDEIVLAKGGRGGKGNAFFKSATHQTPRFSQTGEEGEECNVTFELKLLADVGLVGFPNAGKSTLISAISAAKPKIADYPFTTLEPNLGVVPYDAYKSFVVADIPGIIEGASEGKGLGIRFLKHIERNAVLLFLIPVDSEDLYAEYLILLNELEKFNPTLLDKPRVVALSKVDIISAEERKNINPQKLGFPEDLTVLPISSVAHIGLPVLKDVLWEKLGRS